MIVFASGFAAAAKAGEPRIIRPCDPNSAATVAARRTLQEIDRDIHTLPPAGDPAPLLKRLETLAHSRCFELLDGDIPREAASGLSLRTYWEDGGYQHVASVLDLGKKGGGMVWVAPSMRRALTLEIAPDHRLANLLCPAMDEACSDETEGWRIRAEGALARGAGLRRLQGEGSGPSWYHSTIIDVHDCARWVRKMPPVARFERYRECIDYAAERRSSLPIGSLRAPTRGWLVVEGRRGHHEFCHEVTAYDLQDGATFRAARCESMLSNYRYEALERSYVALEPLREAAWMLLLLDEIQPRVIQGMGVAVPAHVPIELRSHGERKLSGWGRATGRSSRGDILGWRLMDRGKLLGWGFVKWPADDNDDDDAAHAAELLAIAEASPAQRWPEMQVLSSLTGPSRRLEPWLHIADSIRMIAVLLLLSTPSSSAAETVSP